MNKIKLTIMKIYSLNLTLVWIVVYIKLTKCDKIVFKITFHFKCKYGIKILT